MRSGLRAFAVVMCLLPGVIASAFEAPMPPRLPTTVQPGHESPAQSDIPEGNFEFSIAPPIKAPIPKDVETLRFVVNKITVEGTTVFKHGDLLPLTEPLIGQEKSLGDITEVADSIEARYREEGFIMTHVFVPPQRTKNGEFTIRVVEGYVLEIVVDGVDGSLRDHIAAMLSPVKHEKPLTTATVERALLLVNDIPGVKAVGLLKPNAESVGAANLVVSVATQNLSVSAEIDNRQSRYSGPWTASADVVVNSLANSGEQIGAGVSDSVTDPKKQRGLRAHYTQPLGSSGLTATTSFDKTLGQPGYGLKRLRLTTDSVSIAERIGYPIIRSRAENLFLEAGFTAKSAMTSALDNNLSADQWRIVDARLSWSNTGWLEGVTAAGLGISRGLPVLGASRPKQTNLSRAGADPNFTKATLDARRIQPLVSNVSIMLAASGQYAFNRLLAGEQFALGGPQFGRGYDPAELTGDHGIGATAELHYAPRQLVPWTDRTEFYFFYDRGVVWNRASVVESRASSSLLSSAGFGMKTTLSDTVELDLEFARPLIGPEPTVRNGPGRVYLSVQGRF